MIYIINKKHLYYFVNIMKNNIMQNMHVIYKKFYKNKNINLTKHINVISKSNPFYIRLFKVIPFPKTDYVYEEIEKTILDYINKK